jgi:hypothetical protein
VSLRIKHQRHAPPTGKQISQAIADVHGKLLETWEGAAVTRDDPTLRVLLKASRLIEGWVGSATELLNLLISVDREHHILQRGEKLPKDEYAMGTWLRDNYQTVRANGIDLTHPPRKNRKRLWAWRKVTIDRDTCDTSPAQVSPDVPQPNPKADNEKRPNDARDTLNEEQILLNILKGGNP